MLFIFLKFTCFILEINASFKIILKNKNSSIEKPDIVRGTNVKIYAEEFENDDKKKRTVLCFKVNRKKKNKVIHITEITTKGSKTYINDIEGSCEKTTKTYWCGC